MYRFIQRPKRIECDLLTCPAFKHPVVNPMSPSEICSLYFTLKVVHNATLKDKNCEWRVWVRECGCVWVSERERRLCRRECVCVCVCERECVCVCERERERVRECVCVREREFECVCVWE